MHLLQCTVNCKGGDQVEMRWRSGGDQVEISPLLQCCHFNVNVSILKFNDSGLIIIIIVIIITYRVSIKSFPEYKHLLQEN